MTELVDVWADGICPGETIRVSGALLLVTGIETHRQVVDLYTEFGPALRVLRNDLLPVACAGEQVNAA